MDDIIRAYKDAYHRANGKNIIVRRHTRIRYVIQGHQQQEFTEKQMKEFTETLLKREPYFKHE